MCEIIKEIALLVVGTGIGYYANLKVARNRDSEVAKKVVKNQLSYSVELFKICYYLDISKQEKIDSNILWPGTLIIENQCMESIKFLDLSVYEKLLIAKWMKCLDQSEGELVARGQIAGYTLWHRVIFKVGEEMEKLLPEIEKIINRLM